MPVTWKSGASAPREASRNQRGLHGKACPLCFGSNVGVTSADSEIGSFSACCVEVSRLRQPSPKKSPSFRMPIVASFPHARRCGVPAGQGCRGTNACLLFLGLPQCQSPELQARFASPSLEASLAFSSEKKTARPTKSSLAFRLRICIRRFS